MKLPSTPGGWRAFYMDPPWAYSNKRTRSAAANNYPVMNLSELSQLPVAELAAKDSFLFMWATAPFMWTALTLGHSWGFNYKTIAFTWAKRNRKSNTPFFGMGNYTRANVELCLLFTRGSPKVADRGVPQFVWSPILRHSEKPAVVRERIVRLCGNVKRLEMFARHQTPGWKTWGNEILP